MELRQLECFAKTAELGSFTKAALELHISQPALSRSIHLLEEGLGVQLFDRQGKKVTLNNTGKAVLEQARAILDRCDKISEICREVQCRGENTVTLQIMAASDMFPEMLAGFRKKRPGVSIILLQSRHDGEEPADICVYSSVHRKAGKYDKSIMAESLALAVPPGHPLYEAESVSLRELSQCSITSLRPGNDMREIEDFYFGSVGLSPQREIECDTPATLRALLKKGVGTALVPTKTWSSITGSELKLIPLREHQCMRYINAALTTSGRGGNSAAELYDYIVECFSEC